MPRGFRGALMPRRRKSAVVSLTAFRIRLRFLGFAGIGSSPRVRAEVCHRVKWLATYQLTV